MNIQNKIHSFRKAINTGFISYFLFLMSIIAATLFAPISNYTASSFIAKGIFAFLLVIAASLIQREEKLTSQLRQKNMARALLIFFIFIMFLAITFTYSGNPGFGMLKLANLLISFLPLWYGYSVLFLTLTKKRMLVFFAQLGIILAASTIIIVTMHPFTYLGSYSFSLNEWSHVILGRFVGLVFLIFVMMYLNKIIYFKDNTAFIIAFLLLQLNFIIGLRGGIIAVLAVSLLLVAYGFSRKNFKGAILLLTVLLFSSSVFFVSPGIFNKAENRVVNLLRYSEGKPITDGPITAREELFKVSSEIIKNNSFWGVGFGGFRNVKFGEAAYANKYPHNLFLECWTELGIPGLMICFTLLFLILKKMYQINVQLTIFTFYPIILAMFSKDVPDQTLFCLVIANLSLPDKWKNNLKQQLI